MKKILTFLLALIVSVGSISIFMYGQVNNIQPFVLGLDLKGGARVTYTADISAVEEVNISSSLNALREVIEKRVNALGVSEPIVRVSKRSTGEYHLVVELPGVSDINEAIDTIGKTPLLEFKLYNEIGALTDAVVGGEHIRTASVHHEQNVNGGFTGRTNVQVFFNSEGSDLFYALTRDNVGDPMAIVLDGEVISAPIINEPIPGGRAIISGNFSLEQATQLASNLSLGALPIPIALDTTEIVGASLGEEAVTKGINAGIVGFIIICLFLIARYRFVGIIASVALLTYVSLTLLAFQYIGVIITAAGIAGFIISIGIAVDANVLIFERVREELQNKESFFDALQVGRIRAWSAIRDGALTTLIITMLLFWFGTSLIKGFALTFGIGIVISMFTATILTSNLLLLAVLLQKHKKLMI